MFSKKPPVVHHGRSGFTLVELLVPAFRNGGNGHFLFADGHVAGLTPNELKHKHFAVSERIIYYFLIPPSDALAGIPPVSGRSFS